MNWKPILLPDGRLSVPVSQLDGGALYDGRKTLSKSDPDFAKWMKAYEALRAAGQLDDDTPLPTPED